MGTSKLVGKPDRMLITYYGLVSHSRIIIILPVAPCYGNGNKVCLDKSLGFEGIPSAMLMGVA